MSKNNPFVWIMQHGENKSYKCADYVTSTLEFAENHMKEHGLEKGKFVYIPNGISQADWENKESVPHSHKNILNSLKDKGKFIVGYFGGFAISNALDRLIDAAELIEKNDIVFVLVGEGAEKEKLCDRVKRKRLENIIFLEPVKKSCIPELLRYFDCVYMGVKQDLEIYKYGISSTKMYDAMMGEKPIVMSMSDVRTPVESFKCGIKTSIDATELKNAIEKLYFMPEEQRVKMGKSGKEAVISNYEYGKLAEKYEELFPANSSTILLINHYAGSNNMGMDFRPYYLGKEWIKRGYRVKILAADYSHLRRENPKVTKDFQKEIVDEIEYYWIKTTSYKGNGVKRASTMLQFISKLCLGAKRIAKVMQPDVIITASTYPLDIYAANLIKKYSLEEKKACKKYGNNK
ncbi:glycosyltransferase [Extibacter muris]|nr:glycosyltransferase [Extibacter muris]